MAEGKPLTPGSIALARLRVIVARAEESVATSTRANRGERVAYRDAWDRALRAAELAETVWGSNGATSNG
jgi:hypothetical protein